MAIVKMKHLRLMAMQQDREELLHLLQRMGCVEIDEPAVDESDPVWSGLSRPDGADLARARERRNEGERALAALKRYAPDKGGLFKARPQVTEQELFAPDGRKQGEQAVDTILDAERRIAALRAEQARLETQRASLTPWLGLDVPLDCSSTKEVSIRFGTLPASVVISQAQGKLAAQSELVQLTHAGSDTQFHYLLLLCHTSAEEAIQPMLKELGWLRVNLRDWTGTAEDNHRRLTQELERLTQELEQTQHSLEQSGALRGDVCLEIDRTAVEIDRADNDRRLLGTENTFLLEGWVPADRSEEVRTLLERYPSAFELTDPEPEEYPKVPVKLKNNRLTRCMNVITEMYSLPSYDGIDPNPLMFPFFVVFFGMMMADAAYGIIMIAAALVVLRSKPRESTRNFMEGVFWCGISTVVWGALTGGFFGDFIPQIAKIIDPASNVTMPALFTPLDDTVAIMLGSVVLGCIQIITGMTVSIVKKISEGNFIDALFDEITWWIILGGAAMAIFGIGSVAGVPVVLTVGILMLVFGGTREAKGFGKVTKLVGLVYNGVTGFFSDALSYVRLMALMLSGSVIASVFNTLGATFGNVILFVIISLVGNALNLALNLLGCYVHDLRLQCLEFFNRFYQVGGKPYQPLSMQTNYVDLIKEEN